MSKSEGLPSDKPWAEGPDWWRDVRLYVEQTPELAALLVELHLLPVSETDDESEACDQIFTIANHWRERELRLSTQSAGERRSPHSLEGEKDTKLLRAFTPDETRAPGFEIEYWNLTMVRMRGDVVLTVRLPSEFSHYVQTAEGRMAAWHPGAVSSVRFKRDLWRSFVEQIAEADKVFQACDSLDGEMGFDHDDPATEGLKAALSASSARKESSMNTCPTCGADLHGRPDWALREAEHNLRIFALIEEVEALRKGVSVTHVNGDPIPAVRAALGDKQYFVDCLTRLRATVGPTAKEAKNG